MRICSLLSSGTEIVYALGLGDDLVAVSDRCDYPAEAQSKPIASRDVISSNLPSAEIDRLVQESIRAGRGTHTLDEEVLRTAKPELVITQDLCNVCDVGSTDVIEVFRSLRPRPEFLVLTPHTLWDVLETIEEVGRAAGVPDRAGAVIAALRQQVRRVAQVTALTAKRPRVFCMEWMSPPIVGGHWMPEMTWLAGGVDGLGRHGLMSVQLAWDQVVAYQPEVLIIQPCGLTIRRALQEIDCLAALPDWDELPAVHADQVYVVDPAFFTRPGPRLVTGIEILAQLLHPELLAGLIPSGAVVRLTFEDRAAKRGLAQCFHACPMP